MRKNIPNDIRTLCPRCASQYMESGYELTLINPNQPRERCMLCNATNGKDYYISEKKNYKR